MQTCASDSISGGVTQLVENSTFNRGDARSNRVATTLGASPRSVRSRLGTGSLRRARSSEVELRILNPSVRVRLPPGPLSIPGSSNGRTRGSGPRNVGSIPAPGTDREVRPRAQPLTRQRLALYDNSNAARRRSNARRSPACVAEATTNRLQYCGACVLEHCHDCYSWFRGFDSYRRSRALVAHWSSSAFVTRRTRFDSARELHR